MNSWYEKYVMESNKDVETKKTREDIKLNLTDKQYKELTKRALQVGFQTPSQLIEAFIADLTGWQYNGSDEKRIADDWYERAFGIWKDTQAYFRYFLYENKWGIDDMILLLEDEEFFENTYQSYLDEYSYSQNISLDSKEEAKKVLMELTAIEREKIAAEEKAIIEKILNASKTHSNRIEVRFNFSEKLDEITTVTGEYRVNENHLEIMLDDQFKEYEIHQVTADQIQEYKEDDTGLILKGYGIEWKIIK